MGQLQRGPALRSWKIGPSVWGGRGQFSQYSDILGPGKESYVLTSNKGLGMAMWIVGPNEIKRKPMVGRALSPGMREGIQYRPKGKLGSGRTP